jgi:hypothetical protein
MHNAAASDHALTANCFEGPFARRGCRLGPPGGQAILWVRVCRLALVAALGAAGCGTTRVTDTQRTATEQLLVSNAVDQAVSQLDFRVLAGKPVYFDAQYLAGSIDRGYVVSSLRQHLLASGCILQEDRAQATYVVEARSGGIGTDRHQVLIGVPEMNVPSLLPGQPTLIPEIPLAKRTDQKGVAKLAVFAYNRRTGRPVWQSGVVRMVSTSKDTWLLGAGPFRQGTIGDGTEFAGQPLPIPQIPLPLLRGKEHGNEESPPAIAVTRAASWIEPPSDPEMWSTSLPAPQGFFRLIDPLPAVELPPGLAPVLRAGEPAFREDLNRAEGSAGVDDTSPSAKRAVGSEGAPPPGKDPGTRKGTGSPAAGGDRHK